MAMNVLTAPDNQRPLLPEPDIALGRLLQPYDVACPWSLWAAGFCRLPLHLPAVDQGIQMIDELPSQFTINMRA